MLGHSHRIAMQRTPPPSFLVRISPLVLLIVLALALVPWLVPMIFSKRVGHNVQSHALTDAQVLDNHSIIQAAHYDPDQIRLSDTCGGPGGYFPLPIWSWGLAFTCCSVYPTSFEAHGGGWEEGGKWDGNTYFMEREIRNATAVYVPTVDVPVFIRTKFLQLDPSLRIVLVSGSEDIAQPVDLFDPQRAHIMDKSGNKWTFNHKTGKKDASPNPPVPLLEFVSDRRLIRWYVQNYDLIGCRQDVDRSCSSISVGKGGWTKALVDKVRPIPIGLDLHTSAGKPGLGPTLLSKTCSQRHDLHKARSLIPPFKSRPSTCIYGFSSSTSFRRELMEKLSVELTKGSKVFHQTQSSSREAYWKALQHHTFSLSPTSHGMDCHRTWELLALKTVPIVQNTSLVLGGLYEGLPVIVVDDWAEVFVEGALDLFKQQIIDKFGDEPFDQPDVIYRVTNEFWKKKVELDLV